jgi:hypothetical protein
MATHLTSNHATPGLIDHSISITQPSDLDAVETLKAVQGIIGTYLANGTTGGRSRIPTPESSAIPKRLEVDKRKVDDMNGYQAQIVREAADLLSEAVLTSSPGKDIDEVSGQQQTDIKAVESEPTSNIAQAPLNTQNMATDQLDRGARNSAATNTSSGADRMESHGVGTRKLNGDSKANGINTKASPPSSTPQPNQDLLDLTANIAHSISQIATDDAARIKPVTDTLELATALRPPGDTIMGWFANMSVISAVRLFMHWGAFDIIPSSKGDSITYAGLAARVNADEGLIGKSPTSPFVSPVPTSRPQLTR